MRDDRSKLNEPPRLGAVATAFEGALTPMLLTRTPQSIDQDLELIPLTGESWRVADARWPEADARRILGYIEFTDGQYEMMWIRPPRFGACERFDTLEDAVTAASMRRQSRSR